MVSRAVTRLALALLASLLLSTTPAWTEVYSGTYTGDGFTSQTITGIPFRPDLVIIKGDDIDGVGDTTSAVLVTSSMPAGFAKPLKGTQPLLTNLVQSLDANGFTVGDARGTNQYELNVTTPVPTISVTLGDGGGAVGIPTVDLLNSMIYVGTDQGVIYGVEFSFP